jgi:hypothetical protein
VGCSLPPSASISSPFARRRRTRVNIYPGLANWQPVVVARPTQQRTITIARWRGRLFSPHTYRPANEPYAPTGVVQASQSTPTATRCFALRTSLCACTGRVTAKGEWNWSVHGESERYVQYSDCALHNRWLQTPNFLWIETRMSLVGRPGSVVPPWDGVRSSTHRREGCKCPGGYGLPAVVDAREQSGEFLVRDSDRVSTRSTGMSVYSSSYYWLIVIR